MSDALKGIDADLKRWRDVKTKALLALDEAEANIDRLTEAREVLEPTVKAVSKPKEPVAYRRASGKAAPKVTLETLLPKVEALYRADSNGGFTEREVQAEFGLTGPGQYQQVRAALRRLVTSNVLTEAGGEGGGAHYVLTPTAKAASAQ